MQPFYLWVLLLLSFFKNVAYAHRYMQTYSLGYNTKQHNGNDFYFNGRITNK